MTTQELKDWVNVRIGKFFSYIDIRASFAKVIDELTAEQARVTAGAVLKTGNETIGGVKTFTSSPVVPDATAAQHPVSKTQLDADKQIRDTDYQIISNTLAYQTNFDTIEHFGSDWSVSGYINKVTGLVNANSEYASSDFIQILPYQKFICKKMKGSVSVFKVAFYDKNKIPLLTSGVSNTILEDFTTIAPVDAKFVRFCYQSNIEGSVMPEASIYQDKLWKDNKINGLYSPLNQINYGHALTNQRELPWLFTGYRTKIDENNIITNVIKVPIQSGAGISAFTEYRLLIAENESITTPTLMRNVTDKIESINVAIIDNTHTIIKLKSPLFLQFGEVIVFIFKKTSGFTVIGNINPDTSTANKMQFLFAGSGQTDWNQSMTVSSGDENLTPAMVCLLDEKYETEQNTDAWIPRKTKVIATNEDFEILTGATQEEDGWSLLGTGSFARNLHYNVETYMERIKMTASFRVKALAAGVLSFSFGKYLNSGTWGEIRITNGFFQLWYEYSGGGATKYYEQALTGFTMAVGTELVLTISKIAESVTYSVTDGTNTISKTVLHTESELMCLMHAMPYVGITSGQVLLKNISVSSDYDPVYSKIGMWGDSLFEGSTMVSYGLQNRYCAKLANAVGMINCPIFGKGGQALNASFLAEFKAENDWFRPKYCIIGLGTNNLDFNTYAGYIATIVGYLKDKGQIPILVTVTPRPTNATFLPLANDFVRTLGERYIDMNKAVTVDGDPHTWITGYVLADLTHPSVTGHNAMFERIKIDLPELFEV